MLETEGNNLSSLADEVSSGVAINGQLSSSSDADWYKYTTSGPAKLHLTFDLPTDSSYADYFSVQFSKSDGTILSGTETGKDGSLVASVSEAGTYYVKLASTTYYHDSGQYSITLKEEAYDPNYELEHNGYNGSGTLLNSGQKMSGQLFDSSDVDFFYITANQAGTLSVDFDTSTDAAYTDYFTITLQDSDFNILSSTDTGKDTTLSAAVESAGIYWVRVEPTTYYHDDGVFEITATTHDLSDTISYTLPKEIDLSNGNTWTTITATSSLDIDNIIFRFEDNIIDGNGGYGRDFVGLWGHHDSWEDGRSGSILDIGTDNILTTVDIQQIEITEVNGNEIIVTKGQLDNLALPTSLDFVNGYSSSQSIPNSNFDPTNLNYHFDETVALGSAGGELNINASASAASGIDDIVFHLDREVDYGSSETSYSFFGVWGNGDSWDDALSTQVYELSGNNDSGTVNIQRVDVKTNLGTEYVYYYHDLVTLGLQTSFTLTSYNDSYLAADITEPNQNFAIAYDVNSKSSDRLDNALAPISGLSISSTVDKDFYLIEVNDDEQFTIDLIYSSDAGDLDLVIYDEQRNYINSSFTGVDSERVTISQAGTYYVEVFGYDGAEGNYSLSAQSFSGIAEDIYEDNDTFETAFHFGTQSSSVSGYFDDLTIDKAGDDDYYAFTIEAQADLDVSVAFDHDKGDLDIRFLDSAGNWLVESTTTSDEEKISLKGLAAGDYYLVVYGYEGATSSSYSVTSNLTLDLLPENADAYEGNDSFQEAHDLGNISAEQIAITNSNFHDAHDKDFYSFSLNDGNSLGLEVVFSHIDGDLDVELLDTDGNWIDASTTGSDNEYISLSGLVAGTYTLNAYGYDGATVDNYSVRFVEESFENWWDTYDNWWDWHEADQASSISADSYEDNDSFAYPTELGSISTTTDFNNLTIDSSDDVDWFKFKYDASTRVNVGISFDGVAADLDMELFTATNQNFITENWIDGSYGIEGNEEISLFGLASGDYYVKIYEYNDATISNYELTFEVLDATDINDLHDDYEPNNSFETAYDMGTATGEGRVGDLTLTTGDEDWYKAYFVNDGTPNQYISAMFDHQDGDIDIELYDHNGTLLRSSKSATDNETIYLSDIEGGSYYYMRIFAYGDTAFQEYSLDYAFPVEVSEATIDGDVFEGAGGNEIYSSASSVALVSATENLTLHTATDQDWYSFEMRNASSSSSEISVSYDSALGAMNLSLWAVDVGASTPTLVAASASGTGREVINFDSYLAGTYYLQAFGLDGALIPDYSLSIDVTEFEGSGSQSNVIPADQFDRANSNDTSVTATELGTLSTTLNVADLSIHSSTDKDHLQFATTYAGETQITLSFSHEGGDIDTSLKDSGGTEIAYAMSGDDNETLTFQSSIDETYTLEVYGYAGDINRDYDLSIAPKQLNSRRDDYESNDDASSAVTVRDTRASFDDLTLHNASDQDWFEFTIAETAGSSNTVQVTSLLGADAELKIYSADGTTQVGSTVSITNGSGSVDTSGFASGDYYAVVSSTASSNAAASVQLSNYNLYIDQVGGTAPNENANWTVMVYVDGDNNLASAAVDDLNEMEGVVLPENVNVVTLTDLSDAYSTSETWTDTRMGEIAHDPNGYNTYGWAGGQWAGPADALTSELVSVGEKNMGNSATLTDFIDWSTTNHAANNYALVIWDHGGGLSGIAWDDTDGHDKLTISEIKAGIDNSVAFSSTNNLDLIGFDACLMQTYELGLEMAAIADVMVASQETEPGDGWDYQAFLDSLANNPYASAKTLGGYIVDSYDSWYDSSSETLSSVDLTKYQAIDDAIEIFNLAAENASGSDWLLIDDAVESAWSSAAMSYGWAGEEHDLGQLFEYMSANLSNSPLKTAASDVTSAIKAAVIDNSSRQDLSGIQAGLLSDNTSIWSGPGLIGKSGSAWGEFQRLYGISDRSLRSATTENLSPDYSETRDALGRSAQSNNTSLTAFEVGMVSNQTFLENLTIHNATDVDWYNFSTPTALSSVDNTIKINSANSAPLAVSFYDSNRQLLTQREGLENSFDLSESSSYFIKVETSTGRQDISYEIDVDLVASDTSQGIIIDDLAEGSSSNDLLAKATELSFSAENNIALSNLGLSLTEGDEDWFEISAGRISEQSPNQFSIILSDTDLSAAGDVIIEITDASGTLLASSKSIGQAETIIYEKYSSDIFINVKSDTGKILDYKLKLTHADYDVDGDGSVNAQTDGQAIIASLFTDSDTGEVAANTVGSEFEDALSSFMNANKSTLLDVDGDGEVKALTDGVILNAYLNGASLEDIFQFRSINSPLENYEDLQTHLLDILI